MIRDTYRITQNNRKQNEKIEIQSIFGILCNYLYSILSSVQ